METLGMILEPQLDPVGTLDTAPHPTPTWEPQLSRRSRKTGAQGRCAASVNFQLDLESPRI